MANDAPVFDGERLRAARAAKGLTQEALGVLVDKDKFQVSRYESGDVDPSAETLGKLAAALDVRIDAMYRDPSASSWSSPAPRRAGRTPRKSKQRRA
jgi:transcriptional regulator with XRE-family HTH domain